MTPAIGKSYSTACGAVDASVCAVMWSSHASVLRKYVTFHLWDAGRCKAAASLPSSLREEERLGLPSYKPATWRSCYYDPLCSVWMKGLDWKVHNECWVMTQVRLDEFHLTFLKEMQLVCNEYGSSCNSTPLRVTVFVSKVSPPLLPPKKSMFYVLKNYSTVESFGRTYLLSCREFDVQQVFQIKLGNRLLVHAF